MAYNFPHSLKSVDMAMIQEDKISYLIFQTLFPLQGWNLVADLWHGGGRRPCWNEYRVKGVGRPAGARVLIITTLLIYKHEPAAH
jgi:hypothetical protein